MRIVLAYSGSLEGSAAIQWLHDRHAAQVVAVTLDLGQGRELEAIRDRALTLGAQRAHVLDVRDVFAQAFVVPALRADALHRGGVPMALALSRPLIAQKLVEIAGIERADAVAHTGRQTGGGSRLDRLLGALAPALSVMTPAREWAFGPADLAAFGRANGLGATPDDGSAIESNFWGRSLRQAPGIAPPAFFVPRSPGQCPREPAIVDITFERGVPSALNGVALPLAELAASLGTLATTHGVGFVRMDGFICQAPAAVLLHAAHLDLTRAASASDIQQFSATATSAYVDVVESARWFSPLREALDAYFTAAQDRVNGHVRLRLFAGEYGTISTEVLQSPVQASALRIVPSSTQH